MEISFKNKVAFVAGASEGIGAAIAKTLAKAGAAVGLMARRAEPLQKLEKEIKEAGWEALSIAGDVSKPEDVERAITATIEKFGGLHLAVNNAAISGEFSLLHEQTIDNWRKVMSINLDGIFYGMKYEVAAMLQSGGGSIVNIGSVEGHTILPYNTAYTTSKHGLAGLTQTAAKDYARMRIRVNTVSPGVIKTPLVDSQPEISGKMTEVIPIGRIGDPQEIANTVAFLLSDLSSYTTGADFVVDGAYLLRGV
ncbi:MAG: glucose 1-dehydrogenase [Filimonas sp.]|nr:glucose 1-dehydrogenase [Filimonas sp.]